MGLSSAFYRDELWRGLGFTSADDFRQGFIRGYLAPMDPNNLLSQNRKWRAGDIGDHAGGDVAAALHETPAEHAEVEEDTAAIDAVIAETLAA